MSLWKILPENFWGSKLNMHYLKCELQMDETNECICVRLEVDEFQRNIDAQIKEYDY